MMELPRKPYFRLDETKRMEQEFTHYALHSLGEGKIGADEAYALTFEWTRKNLMNGMPKTDEAANNPIYKKALTAVLKAREKRRKK